MSPAVCCDWPRRSWTARTPTPATTTTSSSTSYSHRWPSPTPMANLVYPLGQVLLTVCATVCFTVFCIDSPVCLSVSGRIGQWLRHPHRLRLHRQIRSEPTQGRAVLGIHCHSEDEREEAPVQEVRLCSARAVQYFGRHRDERKGVRQPQYERNKLSIHPSGASTAATAER